MSITYATLCSGIECAGLAADPLGWVQTFCAETDPFARAVLAHHRPHVSNLGDVTTLADRIRQEGATCPDVMITGTPCQAFSIAGLRESLDDVRGNLTMELVRVLDAIDDVRERTGLTDCCNLVWENVPGVLSTKDNAFGCFLGALVGADEAIPPFGRKGKWPRAGVVRGPRRSAAWRIFDAQWFGVAQRRRRMFVVAGAGERFDPSVVLFEPYGMRGDTPPSRKTGENIARPVAGGTKGGSGYRNDADTAENLIPVLAYEGNNTSGPVDIATARSAHGGSHGRLDFETETFLVQCQGTNVGVELDLGGTLRQGNSHGTGGSPVIAFSSKDYGAGVGEISPTLRSMEFADSHANGGGQVAIAFDSRQDTVSSQHVFGSLGSSSPQAQAVCIPSMVVRRLMPIECERLQGLPDNYTDVPYRNKPASDGPRYRAIGNGMAVPCMAWILNRLDRHMKGETRCL